MRIRCAHLTHNVIGKLDLTASSSGGAAAAVSSECFRRINVVYLRAVSGEWSPPLSKQLSTPLYMYICRGHYVITPLHEQ